MKVKKIGKAKPDLENELWAVEGKSEKFQMNRRLIDTNPQVKALLSANHKLIQSDTPSRRKPNRRKEYFEARDKFDAEKKAVLGQVFQEIEEDSYRFPILLQKHKDFDHYRQWVFCLYQGHIYEFDKHGYSDEEMVTAIRQIEPPIIAS